MTKCRTISLAALLLLFLCNMVEISAEQDGRTFRDVTFSVNLPATAPFTVSALTLKGKQIPLDAPVKLDGYWLKDLRLTLINTSPKPITYVAVTLALTQVTVKDHAFKARQGGDPEMGFSAEAGIMPESMRRTDDRVIPPATGAREISIPPGGKVELIFSPDSNDDLVRAYESGVAIDDARFRFSMVWFADNTAFFNEQFHKLVDSSTRNLQRISVSEFYQSDSTKVSK